MFDPYRKWLGIPKDQRPPTHYQLLGLVPGEDDADVIEEAAIRQTAHIRSYQIGPHAKECTQILNEISKARAVLRNPAKKKAYDAELAKKTAATKSSEQVTEKTAPARPTAFDDLDADTAITDVDRDKPAQPVPIVSKERVVPGKGRGMVYGLIAGGVGLVGVVVLVLFLRGGGSASPEPNAGPLTAAAKKGETIKDVKKPSPIGASDKKTLPSPLLPTPLEFPPVGPPSVPPSLEVPPLPEVKNKPPVAKSGKILLAETIYSEPRNTPLRALSLSDDEAFAAFQSSNGIEILDLKTKETNLIAKVLNMEVSVFSPDGSILAVAGRDEVQLFQTKTGTRLHTVDALNSGTMSFSPDGMFLLIGARNTFATKDGKKVKEMGRPLYEPSPVRLLDVRTGKFKHTFTGHGEPVLDVGFGKDGNLLSVGRDRLLRRWNFETGDEREQRKIESGTFSQFNSDGTKLLTVYGPDVKIWDLENGKVAKAFRPTPRFDAQTVDWSDDARTCLVLHVQGGERTIGLWDLEKGEQLDAAEVGDLQALVVSGDGQFALTSERGVLRRWRLTEK